MFSWINILIMATLISAICFFLWRFKKVSHNVQVGYKVIIIVLGFLVWIVMYKAIMTTYHSEFELLSTNKQLTIKLLFVNAPAGGVVGYCAYLIKKYSEHNRVSNYLERAAKRQKFTRWSKK